VFPPQESRQAIARVPDIAEAMTARELGIQPPQRAGTYAGVVVPDVLPAVMVADAVVLADQSILEEAGLRVLPALDFLGERPLFFGGKIAARRRDPQAERHAGGLDRPVPQHATIVPVTGPAYVNGFKPVQDLGDDVR